MRESESCANITVSGTDRRVCQIDSDQQRTGTERADPRQGKAKAGQAKKAPGYGVWSSLRQKRRGPLWTYRQQWEYVEAVSE